MKRERTTTDCIPSLPHELLLEITRVDRWCMSGAMARTSKDMLLRFTEPSVLREIIIAVNQADGVVFRWLLFALPCSFLTTTRYGGGASKKDVMTLNEPVCILPDVVLGYECTQSFVTGGAVCQRLYAREWASDIDVFVHSIAKEEGISAEKRLSLWDEHCQYIDIVPSEFVDMERVMERFDLSIVQQGYYRHHSETLYCTPLALYTAQWHEIVAIPTNECIEYNDGHSHKHIVDIWHYIDIHNRDHQGDANPYHACIQCNLNQSSGHIPFMRWRERMCKYSSRFPEFNILYCKAPSFDEK